MNTVLNETSPFAAFIPCIHMKRMTSVVRAIPYSMENRYG